MCESGLTTCHYKLCCNDERKPAVAKANAKFLALFKVIAICISNDEQHLHDYCGLSNDLQEMKGTPEYCSDRKHAEDVCCANPFSESQPFFMDPLLEAFETCGCSVEKILDKLPDVLWELMTSGIEALADVPTATFLPSFAALAPDHPFRVVMTTRDPQVWEAKRAKEHGLANYVCREDNGDGERLADAEGCMRRAQEASKGDRPLRLSDAFIVLLYTSPDERKEALRSLQDTFAPDLAKRISGGLADGSSSKYGPWFLEMDFFDRTINRKPTKASSGSLEDEREIRNDFFEEVTAAFHRWWNDG